jgi:hypothetical protein
MAAYGSMVAWARAMGHDEAADLLQETLDEEKAADQKLTSLAEAGINQQAAEAAHSDDDDDAAEGSTRARSASGAARQPAKARR